MRVALLVVLPALAHAQLQCGDTVCFHDSLCVPGEADFSDHPLGDDGQPFDFHQDTTTVTGGAFHCACTDEYTGVDCSVPVMLCDEDQHRCYNRGLCVPDPNTNFPYCDCSNAIDWTTGKHYVGRYCEQKAPADSYCDHVVDLVTFCLNGGQCNVNYPSDPHPCVCAPGYGGAHCEYSTAALPKPCDLECKNGGVCYLGEDMDQSSVEQHLSISENTNDQMHCQCPTGFYGELCEVDGKIKAESTPCGDFPCLHGAPCIDGPSGKVCDCKAVWVHPFYYAGQYCESPATAVCENDSLGNPVFCTNFGTCGSGGCECPTRSSGVHCELVQDIDCTLTCLNGGTCTIGDDPNAAKYNYTITFDNDLHQDKQYCACPDGFSGQACEIIAEGPDSNLCGEFACLNGGVCEDNKGAKVCNCLNAVGTDEDGQPIYYDGKYCQYASSVICMDDRADYEVFYCTNGGQCQQDLSMGCSCPEGFGGFSCEFALDDCTLQCQNGGKCTLGSPPDMSYLEAYWWNPDNYANWQFCDCPDGFGGELCEISRKSGQAEAIPCPQGFSCLNGGSCVDKEGNPMADRCNCDDAYIVESNGKTTYYDGVSCQFPSTTTCYENFENGVDFTDGGEAYYCVNFGECRGSDRDSALSGCDCPEGYAGLSCEFVEAVDCKTDCGLNGICRLGAPPSGSHADAYWFNSDASPDYEYCECINGAGGQMCDKVGEDCGDFTCLNGGKCTDEHGNLMADRCNCLHAWERGDNGQPNVYYDGRFCQYASTSLCYEDDSQAYFCMNDGTCPSNPGDEPCACQGGYSGFSCEFIDGTDCTLDCGPDGECRLGSPPGTSPAHAYWYDPDEQGNYQYCECKNGAGGEKCDIKGEACPQGFTCLNGGKCVDENDEPMVGRCNCLDAFQSGTPNIYYDGRFCQYPSTVICKEDDDSAFFCMNGGECAADPENDPCICPAGFAGFMCEFVEGTDCNLDCGDGGTCRLGAPPGGSHAHAYWYNPDDEANYQYCECKEGFGGKFCTEQGISCGDFTCLNGGVCNPEMPDRCDCSQAQTIDGSGSSPDIYYDGRFCQYPSTVICYEDPEDVFFCMNDGRCLPVLTDGCSCPDGFSGHSCEFLAGTDCTLDCQNQGLCRLGSPPGEDLLHAYWFDDNDQDNYQYCECPDGFDGKFCESEIVQCNGFHCVNGGTCMESQKRCDCVESYSTDPSTGQTTYFDGLYCQYASTSTCYEGDEVGDDEVYFCMNGGICQSDFTKGCVCPDGYGGFYCELSDPLDCTLDCKNGGKCTLGSPPGVPMYDAYWYSEEKADDYQWCDCPAGFAGETCEKQGGEQCGDGECHNGGTCITRTVEGEDIYHCDCRTADFGGKYYAGAFCQYAATDVCKKSDDDEGAAYFCVNYGTCKSDYRDGCDCPDNTRGFSCEFVLDASAQTSASGTAPTQTIVDTEEICDLDCNGRGTCRIGVKDISDLGDAANAGHLSYTHDDFRHCVCDSGFVGVQCEHEITECNDSPGDHFCLHGSVCVDGKAECDCSEADSTLGENFAGDYCQYVVEICNTADSDSNPVSYCANGGKCKAHTDKAGADHPGCICPDGFIGERCEITSNKADAKGVGEDPFSKKDRGSSLQGLGIAAIVLSVCAAMAVVMFIMNSCIKRKRFHRREGETSGLIWASKGGYKDSAETINFSPHKAGYSEDYMASFANPSRDPMATALAPDTSEFDAVESDASSGGRGDSDDEPQVFIGPPRDEDGHVLHSVDIL